MRKFFVSNLRLKLIALALAILTWWYVSKEIVHWQGPNKGEPIEAVP